MKNLTSRLIGAGFILSMILIGGCAINYDKIKRQETLKKYHMREATAYKDGFMRTYLTPFGLEHDEDETNEVSRVLEK